ncbi:WD40 repeat-like protein [Colletotrichum eremochloae]|nr:WD40 repeat-like protein [Colletotrichum eremochloae]
MCQVRHTLESHREPITCVAFHPVFSVLASGSEDCNVKVWDWEMGELEKTVKGHTKAVTDVDFRALRVATLLALCLNDTLRVWDVSTGYCIRDVCPSPDGHFLLSVGDDYTGRLWDISVTNPEVKLTLIRHEHVVTCCMLAPPTAYIHLAKFAGQKPPLTTNTTEFMATGSRDKTICLWDGRGIVSRP